MRLELIQAEKVKAQETERNGRGGMMCVHVCFCAVGILPVFAGANLFLLMDLVMLLVFGPGDPCTVEGGGRCLNGKINDSPQLH